MYDFCVTYHHHHQFISSTVNKQYSSVYRAGQQGTKRHCAEYTSSSAIAGRPRDALYIYIYYEIVHKVHNKKKMKKRQGKNKNI